MTTASYQITVPSGQPAEQGSADVQSDGGALILAPPGGEVLRVPFADISSVGEGGPFTVRVALADGATIELSGLGAMRTQLLAELRDGHAGVIAEAAAAVGPAEILTAESAGQPVELRVYDDALLIIGTGWDSRISFSFVTAIREEGCEITVETAGGEPVKLSRMGQRTGEFAALVGDRVAHARGRMSAFLGALLPGLGSMAVRQAGSLLRDGVAVPASALDKIHPEVTEALLRIASRPDRLEAARELGRRGTLAIGFKQVTTVRRAAAGTTAWRDPAAPTHIGEHESPYARSTMAWGGMLGGAPGWGQAQAGAAAVGGAWAGAAGYWPSDALWSLGALGTTVGQRPMSPRADVRRGSLIPATEDLDALVVSGEEPSVLAFVLAQGAGHAAFEILNKPEPVTYVYQAAGADGLAAINRALDDTGFRAAAAVAGGPGAQRPPAGSAAALLAGALAGQVPHDERWSAQIAALLAG